MNSVHRNNTSLRVASKKVLQYARVYTYNRSTSRYPIRLLSSLNSGTKSAPALVIRTSPTYRLEKAEVPVPIEGRHQALVQVSHAAQNPTDGKTYGHFSSFYYRCNKV